MRLEKINPVDFSTAKSYLRTHVKTIPKLTDWTSLVLMKRLGITKILSLDRDFRKASSLAGFKWVERISDPEQIPTAIDSIF